MAGGGARTTSAVTGQRSSIELRPRLGQQNLRNDRRSVKQTTLKVQAADAKEVKWGTPLKKRMRTEQISG